MNTIAFGDLPIPDGFVFIVPVGLRSKRAVLDTLADGLSFPQYFGRNWDALEECLSDLSWLMDQHITIVHQDVPLINNPEDLRTYLSILGSAIDRWSDDASRELVVTFPASAENMMRQFLQ